MELEDWVKAKAGQDVTEFYVVPKDVTLNEFRLASLIVEATGWAQTKSTILDEADLARVVWGWLKEVRAQGRDEGMEEAAILVDDHDPQLAEYIRKRITPGDPNSE